MLKRSVIAVALAAILLTSYSISQADKKNKEVKLDGIKCMVCKMQVSKDLTADYKGAKVYFGCPSCPSRFEKDTAKYSTKANAQLVATKQARQKACPLSGKPCAKDVKLAVGGADVAFCCAKCKEAVAKLEGDTQLAKVFSDAAFKKGFRVPKKTK